MFLILTFVFLAFSPMMAQEDPIPPKRTRAAKVGFFGGPMPAWLFVDTKPINDLLLSAGGTPLTENGIFMFGGGGAVYVGIIPNFRLGGVGMEGSTSTKSVDQSGIRRDAELSVGFGGLTFEYVIPIVPRLDVAGGIMIGWGGVDLILRQDTGTNLTWEEEWTNYGSGNYEDPAFGQVGNISRKLSGSFFAWCPSVHVEYAILGWLAVRLGASYLGMSAPAWTVDDEYDLIGVPGEIKGDGFMISGGVFVGTF
jgi:hypothetical protein